MKWIFFAAIQEFEDLPHEFEDFDGDVCDDEFDFDFDYDFDLLFGERNYRMNPRINYCDHWNDDEFVKRFRMTKHTVEYVLSLIEPKLINSNPYRKR